MRELIVNEKYNEKKIIKYLLDMFPNLNTNILYKTLRKKDIKVNDKRINENILLSKGDNIKIYIADEILFNNFQNSKTKIDIDIIFEDTNILIVNKPSGIEVVGSNSLTSKILELKGNNQYISPCHRLDRNTSGLVLFAKNEQSLEILLAKFKNHEIEKHYLAKVYGIPKEKSKKMMAYLFKDSKKSLVYISDEPHKGYEKIITLYKVIKTNIVENTSILDVNLYTGKTHQIRAHLAHIGFPIIGDGKYGINKINKEFGVKYQELISYLIKFNFTTDSGILNYLSSKTFKLNINKIEMLN